MKKIKLKFVGFWPEMNEHNNIYYDILSKRYDVILSDAPDYIIASMYNSPLEYLRYPKALRIMHSGEDYLPDMNIFDYAVGYDRFQLWGVSDNDLIQRYFRWPFGFAWDLNGILSQMNGISSEDVEEVYNKKRKFCNFIYGHESYKGRREKLLDVLCSYKCVDSAGIYRNNMPENKVVQINEKVEFNREYKFSIAAETVQYPGMTTEKIYDAFRGNSIPIYFGDPFVGEIFEENSFIRWDGRDESLDTVLEKVIELDLNEKKYKEMISLPKFRDKNIIENTKESFSQWLYKIFDLDIDVAKQCIPIGGPSQRAGYEEKLISTFNTKEIPSIKNGIRRAQWNFREIGRKFGRKKD